VVEHLADLSPVKLEVAVGEVHKCNASNEEEHVGVVALTLRLKRIVAQLVTIRLIVYVVLLLPVVSMRVRREDVLVTITRVIITRILTIAVAVTYWERGRSLW